MKNKEQKFSYESQTKFVPFSCKFEKKLFSQITNSTKKVISKYKIFKEWQ